VAGAAGAAAAASSSEASSIMIFEEDTSLMQNYQLFPPPIPEKPILRPIWVMKLLYEIIKKGSFLGLKIYMPKEIWYQYDVELEDLDLKMAMCESVTELLKGLATRFPKQEEDEMTFQDLDGICGELSYLQEKLIARISSKSNPLNDKKNKGVKKDKKSSTKNLRKKCIVPTILEKHESKKGTIHQNIDSYRFLLEAVLDKIPLILDNWIRTTERMKLTKECIVKIVDFFEIAFLPMVLDDYKLLFIEYINKLSRTLTTIKVSS